MMELANKMDDATERIIENAVELASDCLEKLQERWDIGRSAIIANFIIPWAIEAENRYQELLVRDEDVPYYDFIIDFGAKKLERENCK